MQPYIPDFHACLGAAGLAFAAWLMVGLGTIFAGRDQAVETRLVAGWGALCLILTASAVVSSLDLRIPLACVAAVAAVGHAWSLRSTGWSLRDPMRPRWQGATALSLLTLPLWLVMLAARPAGIDTWWNLLPNVAYLYDHGRFPIEGGPESYSFLPVAPYNTQFVAFAASVASGSLAENGLALFNVLLLCAAALLFARRLATAPGRRAPPLWACALGCLLVVPLNPGFTPNVFFSSYGETGLAVTALFVVSLVADMLDDFVHGRPARGGAAIALALAAMVNVKQSGLGLVLSVGVAALALAVAHPMLRATRAPARLAVCLAPAIGLYGLWRLYVTTEFPFGELRMMPVSDWNWSLLPQIAASIIHVVLQKIAYFGCVAAIVVLGVRRLATRAFDRDTALLALAGGAPILFTGFLVFTYLAHFDPSSAADAHSFFRYSVQLSMVTVFALACAARPWAASRLSAMSGRTWRRLAAVATLATLGLPIAGIRLLRFDLDAPQPTLWTIARAVAAELDGKRIALLLPGDVDDGVGSMLRGVMMFVPPRARDLDIVIRLAADPATLAAVAAEGYDTALISCTAADLAGAPGLEQVPAGVAALVRRVGAGWRVVQSWQYPADLAGRRFAGLIERAPVCAGPVRAVPPAIAWHRPS